MVSFDTPDNAPLPDLTPLQLRRLRAVLAALRDRGPMDADEVARLCLTPRQVMSLMTDEEKQDVTGRTIGALIDLLEDDGSEVPLAVALKQWKRKEDGLRATMTWDTLPPIVKQSAYRDARRLIDQAVELGYVHPFPPEKNPPTLWRLTPAGGAALDQLSRTD